MTDLYDRNRDAVKQFVIDVQHLTNFREIHNAMRSFSKCTGIHMKKTLLVRAYKELGLDSPEFYKCIMKKEMRTQSGVLVVAIFTSGHPEYTNSSGQRVKQRFSCKHDCYYCPNEPAHEGNQFQVQPRSYLTLEPGVQRANQNHFDCVSQIHSRLNNYIAMGHLVDKLEIIVLGGTWSEYPVEYQTEFVRDIYFAANTFISSRKTRQTLEEEIAMNEIAKVHVIGLTLETRPDSITIDELKRFRRFGCTRVQIGVQHTDNRILKLSNRGCTTKDTINATALLKVNGFKVDYHLMPVLYGATPDIDLKMFNEVLNSPDLQADQWKIYPCSAVPYSKLFDLLQNGKYQPYSDEELKDVLLKVKPKVHPYIRLNRVIRDIPLTYIAGGCSTPNMREVLELELKKRGEACKCIRCREPKCKNISNDTGWFKRIVYISNNGVEVFWSWESKQVLFSFLRLRFPQKYKTHEILSELNRSVLIRELHTYGKMTPVGNDRKLQKNQHHGLGTRLLLAAEWESWLRGYRLITVISGVGVRPYYIKRGYTIRTHNGYLQKRITLFYLIVDTIKFMSRLLFTSKWCIYYIRL